MNAECVPIETQSPSETAALGERFARLLRKGTVVGLHGELASGKTCFVRGMARFFSRGNEVHSPTFTLVNQYGSSPPLYHLDLYRLSGAADVLDLGCEELFDSDGICVIEWADRAQGLLPARRIEIEFSHVGGDRRLIRMRNLGALPAGQLAECFPPLSC